MIEGSGSIPLTLIRIQRRPKNMGTRWIRIRIRNTVYHEAKIVSKTLKLPIGLAGPAGLSDLLCSVCSFKFWHILQIFWSWSSRYIYIIFKDKKSKRSHKTVGIKVFSYYFCWMIGGSGSIPLTSGSGSGRPKSGHGGSGSGFGYGTLSIMKWILFDFSSLKNYVNVLSKRKKQKSLVSWRLVTKIAGSGFRIH